MKTTISILLLLPFVGWAIICVILYIQFSIHCSGHMKRAADANSVPLAISELREVVSHADQKGWKSGYTSTLYKTPDEDIGFWYSNMTSSLRELESLPSEVSSLEKSNVLMKLRETLTDHGKESTDLTYPPGLSVAPNNVAFMIFGWISGVLAAIGALMLYNEHG